jgi:predicted NAD/FAD-dependent oxidoreductase
VSRLLDRDPVAQTVARVLDALHYEPITTLHFEFAWTTPTATIGMLMLDGNPGQWLFWQQLANGQWRASVVISAHHRLQSEDRLVSQALSQLRHSYRLPIPTWQLVITEKRATYACTPKQRRLLATLPKQIGNLHFAGDWCFPELPATLEAAVISGDHAAQRILESYRNA